MTKYREGRVLTQGIEVVVDAHHRNLLDAFEQAGFEPEYHCREGVCGACRQTLISGEVSYHKKPLAHVASNEILPCCCKPKGKIEIAERPPVKKRIA